MNAIVRRRPLCLTTTAWFRQCSCGLAKRWCGRRNQCYLKLRFLKWMSHMSACIGRDCLHYRFHPLRCGGMVMRLFVALSVGFGMVSRRPTVLRFGCLTFSSMLTLCLQRETLDPCDSLLLANGRMDEMCLTLSYVDLGSSNARVGLQKCGKKFCDTKVLS